ncbi:flippase-like domain-containing protein [Myxococcota bacterium]
MFQFSLLVLGAGLLIALLAHMDFAEVGARLTQVGWLLPAAVVIHLIGIMLMARGWYEVIDPRFSKAGFGEVLSAYWTGHVINSLTPVKSLGDVLAGTILKDRDKLDGEELVASLVLLNLIASLASLVFVFAGPVICIIAGFHARVSLSLLVGFLGILFPVALFYVLMRLGLAGRVLRLLNRLPGVRFKDPDAWIARAREVDHRIRVSLTIRRAPFLRSLSSWLLVRLLQTLEIWILLFALLPATGTSDLVLLAILAQTGALLVGGLLSFVPGQIGVAEGGSAFLFGMIGYPPVVGLSMELVRRVCKLAGIGVGLALGSNQLLRSRSTPSPGG